MKNSKKTLKLPTLMEVMKLNEDENDAPIVAQDSSGVVDNPGAPLELQNISLDQKVDRFMIQYERESLPNSAMYREPEIEIPEVEKEKTKTENKFLPSIKKLFFEQDAGAGGGDMTDPTASAAASPAEPDPKSEVAPPKINIQNFARSIARLINNYNSLADPKTTIMNRSKAYILKNYDMNTAKELMIILETQYDLSPKSEGDPEVTKGPPAAGAFGGGGAGGGGAT